MITAPADAVVEKLGGEIGKLVVQIAMLTAANERLQVENDQLKAGGKGTQTA